MAVEREVIFEFVRLGSAVKVTAVDAASGVEVSIIGGRRAGAEASRPTEAQLRAGAARPGRSLTKSII
jgi:hypothetical protein